MPLSLTLGQCFSPVAGCSGRYNVTGYIVAEGDELEERTRTGIKAARRNGTTMAARAVR